MLGIGTEPRRAAAVLLCLATAAASGCGAGGGADQDAGPDPDGVRTEGGWVQGVIQAGAEAFLGIPFAAPPVGDLRWKPPQPAPEWSEPLEAVRFSAACPQPSDDTGGGDTEALGQEDCLYLNVWTPADRTDQQRLPVLVFLHGGGNFLGSTADATDSIMDTHGGPPLYGGARLAARQRVVVVTTNYRLGALGFLTHPSLAAEAASGTSGNYGLMDQIAALEWVGRNIAAFGGDRARITLFGQSGGARDVLLLVTSPLAAGLFSRVAFHSGPTTAQDAASAASHSEALFAEMGCDGEADPPTCMRAKEPRALVLAEASQPDGLASGAFRPTVDGQVVTGQPRDVIAAGQFNQVPCLLGTNGLEYGHRWQEMTDQGYPVAVTRLYGQQLGLQVLAKYPLEDYASGAQAYQTMMSDRNVTCPIRRLARDLAAAQPEPIFLYRFHQILSAPERWADAAYHTTELLYLFQHMDGEAFEASDDDRRMEAVMGQYWAAFASAADPSSSDLAAWPAFAGPAEQHMDLRPIPAAGQDLKKELCDFWDGLLP